MSDCDEYSQIFFFKNVKNLTNNPTWRLALVYVILFIRFIFQGKDFTNDKLDFPLFAVSDFCKKKPVYSTDKR